MAVKLQWSDAIFHYRMKKYDHQEIEKKWQDIWKEEKVFQATENSQKPKWYSLIEFPYPSGDGLHVGHVRSNTAMDIISRKRRMEGYNVLYPIGWDAFGLPTENYAIKTGKDPRIVTKENTDTFRRQLQSIGFSFDWSREINTTDPKYYAWTQWIFLQMFKAGLAYKAKTEINWCPKDKIGLANEEVINGCCERCGTPVEKREKDQWVLAITKYADRLDKDLDIVDYLPQVKIQQRNWIGRSEGAEITFNLTGTDKKITVFTTRPDTLFGVTFLVLSPKLAREVTGKDFGIKSENERETKEKIGFDTGLKAINPGTQEEIPVWTANYVSSEYGTGAIMAVPAHDDRDFEFAKKYDLPIRYVVIPRMIDTNNPHQEGKEIVFRNAVIAVVRNPKTGEIINLKWKKQPWTTFVMGGIEDGEDPVEAARREIIEETGYKNIRFVRILGGPVQSEFFAAHKGVNRVAHTYQVLFELENDEHDELSGEEAEIHEVIWVDPKTIDPTSLAHIEASLILDRLEKGEKPYGDDGILINSGEFSRTPSEDAKKKITEAVGGKWVTKFKLRDWIFSRQRYWGEPIPLIHCEKCGWVAVPEKDLPVTLPQVEKYEPTDTGESPLANITDWINTTCPTCGGVAKRETDVMPNWAGSSWYYLRYMDPHNDAAFADKENVKYWSPVDWYNGGMEHTTLHLLYSRFWHKFLFDQGLVPTNEPYQKRTSHGLILAEGGEKMSKSKGNVVNPDKIVDLYGADSLRLYEMFMGPFDQAIAWNTESIIGVRRFLEKVWKIGIRLLEEGEKQSPQILSVLIHKTIKKVSDDIEGMRFNTAISALMVLANEMDSTMSKNDAKEGIARQDFETFLKLLSPFAPHIVEELWHELDHKKTAVFETWPIADMSSVIEEGATVAVQINGKVRGTVHISRESNENTVLGVVHEDPSIEKWLSGKEIEKVIYIKNKLINIVLRQS